MMYVTSSTGAPLITAPLVPRPLVYPSKPEAPPTPVNTPGASCTSCVKLRVFSGRSRISAEARTCPISEDAVSIALALAETLTCSVTPPISSARSSCSRCPTPKVTSAVLSRNPGWRTVTEYRPAGSGSELYSPLAFVTVERFTFVVRLRKSTAAPATGAFCGSVTTPTSDPCSICPHNANDRNSPANTRVMAPPPFASNCLAMAGLHRPAVLKVDFHQLFARRYPRHYLLRAGVDHGAAVRIRVFTVDAERDPTRMRPFGRVLEKWHIGDMLRRQ